MSQYPSLPYSIEVFFAAMAEYNRLWFPEAGLLVLAMAVVFALAARPLPRRPEASARLVGALLAAAWVWVGAAHQMQHMATLNFLAPIYGRAWIVQGALIALSCTILGRVRFRFSGDTRGRTGLVLALFGLIGYPLAVLSLGYDWRAVPLAGLAPEPTAIFTAGILAAARARNGAHPPVHLFVLPLGWAGVAGVSATLLDFPLDYTVPVAAVAATALNMPVGRLLGRLKAFREKHR